MAKAKTLAEWLDQFAHLREGEVSDLTAANYESTFLYLRQFFKGDPKIRSITAADADDWSVWLRREHDIAEATVCSHISRAKEIFNRAKRRQMIRANPFEAIPCTPPKRVQDWRELTRDEVDRIVAACPTPDWKRFVGACAYEGLRRGEALRLDYRHIDLARRRITIWPAGGEETTKQALREVLLVPEFEALLEPGAEGLVAKGIPTYSMGLHRPMAGYKRRGSGAYVPGILEAAGVEKFTSPYHTLRRWRATSWREEFPPWVVDRWMGHSAEVASEFYVTIPDTYYQGAGASRKEIA